MVGCLDVWLRLGDVVVTKCWLLLFWWSVGCCDLRRWLNLVGWVVKGVGRWCNCIWWRKGVGRWCNCNMLQKAVEEYPSEYAIENKMIGEHSRLYVQKS